MSDLGKRLQSLRETHGLSQRALARRSGISNALISLIEKDKTSPSIASLEKILDSFPIGLADFFAIPAGSRPPSSRMDHGGPRTAATTSDPRDGAGPEV
ncbi:transcriptional regulator with XRE-family HTH domain [Azospirillum agricola]|uniref:helix-turn-helix domain-containing protein n=1 Tax=Azospirillum agricola TaxID=1720247 RepID=UPI001AE30460|nr:helix-turn-helix domain-containing protein [Azospirillum agricola]MBP2229211.1 transcriptional regulator with XRE-family HTH domain [Azospirillum agricola]